MLTYKHERFLAEAIEGVVAQQCDFPFELIIGEDCSPDRSREIALEYQRRYPHLIRTLTSDQNVGSQENARRCQHATRGNYIAICEGDDCWTDATKLARQVDVMHRHSDCSMVCHAAKLLDVSTGRFTEIQRWPFGSRQFSLSDLIFGDGGMVPTASILVKRAIVLDEPTWAVHAPVGDYALVIKAALAGKVIYLDRVMSIYRTNVPHSWTMRHLPTFPERLAYADKIEQMLHALRGEAGPRVERPVRYTVSKYYSDVIVRLEGKRQERARIFDRVRDKLHGSDRILAWLAARHGVRLVFAKDWMRKSKTLVRLLCSQFNYRI